MLKLFKKKKKEEEETPPADSQESAEGEATEEKKPEKKEPIDPTSSSAVIKLSTEIDRIKASVESFGEVRKSLSENISGVREQVGELRAMIMDRDRTIQELELKAVKAADLVETVQPEKLMIEIQREDAKFEALKANMEGNEAIMDRVMEELRELRKKLEFFRGVEEVVKLSEEVKSELVEIKKTQAAIHIDADKVETIYSELRKKHKDVDMFNDNLQEFKVNLEQNSKEIESINTRLSNLADKSEVERLTNKVEKYIESLKTINKSSSLTKDIGQLKNILESLK